MQASIASPLSLCSYSLLGHRPAKASIIEPVCGLLFCWTVRGRSSAGRASRSQCEGQGFDPPRLHHQIQGVSTLLIVDRKAFGPLTVQSEAFHVASITKRRSRYRVHIRRERTVLSKTFIQLQDARAWARKAESGAWDPVGTRNEDGHPPNYSTHGNSDHCSQAIQRRAIDAERKSIFGLRWRHRPGVLQSLPQSGNPRPPFS